MEDYKKALNYSFLLLKYRARSEEEIKYRLKRKKYNTKTIEKVLDYLKENNYLNDEDFTRMFVSSSLNKGWGGRKINFALKKLGINEELIEKALVDKKGQREKLRELIKKRLTRYKGDKNLYQKIVRQLVTRGFEYSDILKEMQAIDIGKFNPYED